MATIAIRKAMRKKHEIGVAALVLAAPAIVLLVIFRVIPLIEAGRLSLSDWSGFTPPRFVGFANFTGNLTDPNFWAALRNNALFALATPVWVVGPLVIALYLHRRVPGRRVLSTAFILPIIMGPIITAVEFGLLLSYDGPVNRVLRAVGLGSWATSWLDHTDWALVAIVIVAMWGSCGIGFLIYLAALDSVDQELIDAARVDGARDHQVQRYVTVPSIRPAIEFWTVVILILSFTQMFPLVYGLTAGGPGYSTQTLDYDVYSQGFQNGRLGYADAVGVLLLAFVVVIISGAFALMRRGRA